MGAVAHARTDTPAAPPMRRSRLFTGDSQAVRGRFPRTVRGIERDVAEEASERARRRNGRRSGRRPSGRRPGGQPGHEGHGFRVPDEYDDLGKVVPSCETLVTERS